MDEATTGFYRWGAYVHTAQAMSAEAQSADADTDGSSTDEFTYYPQVTQHPTTIIEGDVVDLVTGADLDSDKESTDSSFGVVIEDPEVAAGTLWRNTDIPEGFASASEFNDALRVAINGDDLDYVRGQEVTDETIEEARERIAETLGVEDTEDLDYDEHSISGTDFKVADPDDGEASIQYNSDGEETGIDVGGGEFESEQVEEFGADRIMVWYGGMAGQFIGRGLDFNGMPFARYTNPDDEDELPFLVKGLFQVPLGWRGDADIEQYGGDMVETTDRSKLARAESNDGLGRPPRVARPPVLRDDLDGRTFIAIGRYDGGRMHEVHIGRAIEDYDELVDAIKSDDGEPEDLYDEVSMRYDQSADEVLNAEFGGDVFALYHGEGWMPEPDEVQDWADDGSGGSFDSPEVDVDSEAVEHPTEQEREFAQGIAEKIAGTGVSPDEEIFPTDDGNVDLAGIVERSADEFQVEPDVESIRRLVYENTAHLSTDDL